jgi:hypothetical protein
MPVFFEHSGFEASRRWGKAALRGTEVGWEEMFERLTGVVEKKRGASARVDETVWTLTDRFRPKESKETAMANVIQVAPPKTRSRGRGFFWLGIGLCLLGPILTMILMQMGQLGLPPWYALALSTVGVGLLLVAVIRRAGIARIIFLGLFGLFCAFQWFLVVFMSKLPAYEGPARVGDKLPTFTTTLADGSSFTEKNLESGQPSVLVFYRGHW